LIINHELEFQNHFWHLTKVNNIYFPEHQHQHTQHTSFQSSHPNQSINQSIIFTTIHQHSDVFQPKFGFILSWLHQLCLLLQVGDMPVHLASSYGHLDVVRYLIEKCGADVNATDYVSEFDGLIDQLFRTQHTLPHC
jgi:hypothetical protein